MDEVCHGRMQAPLTGGHAPLVHCSTRWFPGVDQGVDQGWIRVDQGGSRVDQVFTSRRGRQKRMGDVGAPHSCVARGGGRTCPFVLIKGENAVPVARAGLMAQVDFPAERHEGTRAVLVANSGNGETKSLLSRFLCSRNWGTGAATFAFSLSAVQVPDRQVPNYVSIPV